MKFLFATATILLAGSISHAEFSYNFRCLGENQNQIIHLKIGASGIEEAHFKREFGFLNQYQISSQYSDYGSMQFIWSHEVSDKNAVLRLDMVTGSLWAGWLTVDKTESIEITCSN